MPPSTRDHLLAMAKGRTYFGHQSVGENLLQGLAELAQHEQVPLPVTSATGATAFSTPGVVHERLGENEKPFTKIEAFERAIEGGVGGRAVVAFFKLCYVDFTAATDVDSIFERYRETIARLKPRHPTTKFGHVTSPLTVTQQGIKAAIKALLGRPRWGEAENAVRHRYNERLRQTYAGKEPFFDLARLEAMRPDGSLESFSYEGRSIPRLVGVYSDDGQHLNAMGRSYVAAKLASFVAETLGG
jgi:hypothetical protein